jgi:hypothetical protein
VDTIKNIPFNLALFLIGAIFIFLGLTGGFTLGSYSFVIQETWSRVISVLVGGTLATSAIYTEIKLKLFTEKQSAESIENSRSLVKPNPELPTTLAAEKFFYTLDEVGAKNFPNIVKGAKRLKILSRTAINLLSSYQNIFRQLARDECQIQLLFVDPSSEAANLVYGSNYEIYLNNITSAARHLRNLFSLYKDQIKIRIVKHAPTLSIIIVEKEEVKESYMQVQLYFLHSAVGRDRPLFQVTKEDKWYRIFEKEFEMLWENAQAWDIDSFLEKE